jgi:DNA repair protein RadC
MQNVLDAPPLLPDLLHRLQFIRGRRQEHLVCFALDTSGHILHRHTVFIGTVSQSFASPREIFARALKSFAYAIVVAHNHPSGVVTPSDGDIETTRILESAGVLLGVHLQDHIIVGKDDYYSFAEQGLLLPIPLLAQSMGIGNDTIEGQE